MSPLPQLLRRTGAALAGALLAWTPALAGGPLLIDHALAPDERGVWARRYTLGLEYGVLALDLGGALWLGGQDRLGRSAWQSADAMVLGQLAAQAGKFAFGRERPSQNSDPGVWFHGAKAQSFPSGEVTLQASFVTPFVARYGAQTPAVWALELLPAFDAAARVRQGGHWTSDVLAGWALGTASGLLAARRDSPFFLELMPGGVQAGLRARLP
jgi:undecaprenyl-diphosphatase